MGCFGEPLLKKFGAEPPEEWVLGMGSLDPRQIARGMRRVVFGWKGGPPNLSDFMRLCRTVGTDEFDEGPKELVPLTHEAPDPWLLAGNRHLLGHILRRVMQNSRCYGDGATSAALRASGVELESRGLDQHLLDASPRFIANVELLVRAKNAWVTDMQDVGANGQIPTETQRAIWRDYIDAAEREIARPQ